MNSVQRILMRWIERQLQPMYEQSLLRERDEAFALGLTWTCFRGLALAMAKKNHPFDFEPNDTTMR